MSKIFSRLFHVRFGEVDPYGHVRPSAFFRYLVETAWDWSKSVGWDLEDYEQAGVTWVILETALELFQPLYYDDVLEATIWMMAWRRVRGSRACEMKDYFSEVLIARMVQRVAAVEPHTLRPLAAPQGMREDFQLPDPRQVALPPFPQLPPLPEHAFRTRHTVRWADLDSVGILYNPVFVDLVESAGVALRDAAGWPPGRLQQGGLAVVPRAVHIKHLATAAWGDVLETTLLPTRVADDHWVEMASIKRLSDHAEVAQCVATWGLWDQEREKAVALPEDLGAALARRGAEGD